MKGSQTFHVNSEVSMKENEHVLLKVRQRDGAFKTIKEIRDFFINEGFYKKADDLLKSFQFVSLRALPNSKILMEIPEGIQVHFEDSLADMLGFVDHHFSSGTFTSEFSLDLDAGISEIFVYTDIIESHHVGDSYSPLLRILPCSNQKSDQIVKHYDVPIYFPVRKKFLDVIEIELRSSAGQKIVFSSGKSFLLLSFRKRRV